MANLTTEQFENKCMDIIEQIVAIDIKQDRAGAIVVAQKMLDKATEKGNQKIIDIYARVLHEFEIATDEEYNLLRKQIFGE